MKLIFITIGLLCLCVGCVSHDRNAGLLTRELEHYISDKDAHIGVAVIIDDLDTVGVNMTDTFPMLSVYKFPIALAAGKHCSKYGLTLDELCQVCVRELRSDMYSPIIERYTDVDSIELTMRELLEYALVYSDNNASDIILRELSGSDAVQQYLDSLNCGGISIKTTEAQMYDDNELCYSNSATPIDVARLFDRFDREFNDCISTEIKRLMEGCTTGTDRLAAPLVNSGAIIGHKTGTGFTLPDGRLMAINDCGYVHTPGGHRYSIAVFVAGSGYDMNRTSQLIAEISELVNLHVERTK